MLVLCALPSKKIGVTRERLYSKETERKITGNQGGWVAKKLGQTKTQRGEIGSSTKPAPRTGGGWGGGWEESRGRETAITRLAWVWVATVRTEERR